MANLILTQTDNIAGCGAVIGCSGGTIAMVPQAREATKDGTPGVGELSVTILREATQAGVMFQSANNEPGKTTWEAGDWVIRFNVTTVQDTITWEDTYVCRFNNACGSLAVVGSLTGQAISLSTSGVKQMTVPGAEQAANLSDEIYIVLLFANSSPHVDKVFGFIPDQNIDTPIVVVAGQDFIKIIDEAMQLNEGTLRPRVMLRIRNEPEQLNEGTLRPRIMKRIKNETEQLNEGIVRRKSMVRMIAETLQINEGVLKFKGVIKVIDETLQINEGILKLKCIIKAIDETLQISEGIVRVRKLVRLIAETLQLNEGIAAFRKMLRVVDETLQISENILRVRKLVRLIAENVSISEGSLIRKAMVRVIDESVSLIENVVKKLKLAGLVKVINESVHVSESILRPRKLVRIIMESISISEGLLKINSFIARMITGWLKIEAKTEEDFKIEGEIDR